MHLRTIVDRGIIRFLFYKKILIRVLGGEPPPGGPGHLNLPAPVSVSETRTSRHVVSLFPDVASRNPRGRAAGGTCHFILQPFVVVVVVVSVVSISIYIV